MLQFVGATHRHEVRKQKEGSRAEHFEQPISQMRVERAKVHVIGADQAPRLEDPKLPRYHGLLCGTVTVWYPLAWGLDHTVRSHTPDD